MTVRIIPSDVEVIFETDLEDSEITKFIETANMVVENVLVASGCAYTEQELEELELYLSAHFCALKDQRIHAEGVDVLSVTYQGRTSMGLDSTHYGQTAQLLDRFGVLKNLGKKSEAFLRAIPS